MEAIKQQNSNGARIDKSVGLCLIDAKKNLIKLIFISVSKKVEMLF